MGLLADVKKQDAEVKAPVAAVADKSEKKAKAKERKAAKQAALKKVIEYLEKNPIKELEAEVKLLKPSERAPGAGFGGPSKLVQIFGEKPAKGFKISALDCFTKFKMGYPEMRKLMKKAAEKGINIKLDAASQTYVVE